MGKTYKISLDLGFDVLKDLPLREIEVNTFNFSGGEPHVKLLDTEDLGITHEDELIISARYKSFQDLGTLALTVDAARRVGFRSISVMLPYLPAARQDRVMVAGEPLSLKVVTDFLNNLKLHQIVIVDAHSDVATALLDNCTNISNHDFIKNVLGDIAEEEVLIISPDAGANKKSYALCEDLGINQDRLIKCDKHRDVTNGIISHVEVYSDDIYSKTCLIVDDICDGGFTFELTAKALYEKGASKVYLAVTHGIFSKGFSKLEQLFTKVYTTNSFDGERSDLVKELDFL